MVAAPAKKKKKAEKKQARPNPFLQNFDHLEDISILYLKQFIDSIDLEDDKELAFRICQILEENAILRDEKRGKLSRPYTSQSGTKPLPKEGFYAEGFELEDDDDDDPDTQDSAKDGIFFRGLSETFPAKRAKYLKSANSKPYKPRYDDDATSFKVDPKDWAQIKTYLAERVKKLPNRKPGIRGGSNPQHENLMNLAKSLGVAQDERNLLELLLALYHTSRLQAFFFELTGAERTKQGRNPMRQCLARALKITPTRLTEILKNDGVLRRKQLLEEDHTESSERSLGLPYLEDMIMSLIDHPGITIEQMIAEVLGDPKTTHRKWTDFKGMGKKWTMLQRYVEGCVKEGRGGTVLLVGSVGLGKSDMIKALCKELGIPLYFPGENAAEIVRNQTQGASPEMARFEAWRHGMTLLGASSAAEKRDIPHCAMFVDEVGELLDSKGMGRQSDGNYGNGKLSRLDMHETIEKTPIITFFAGNNQTKWDPGFLSRMGMVISLDTPDYAYSRTIWNTLVTEQGMQHAFNEGDIERLASEFEIPPRLMENAVLFAKRTGGGLAEALFDLQEKADLLYGGLDNVRTAQPDMEPFYPELVATDNIDATELLRRLKLVEKKPMSLLLSGPEGSGKGVLAQQFTKLSGRRLRTITFEDLKADSYDAAQTRIRGFFEDAANDNVVLNLVGFEAATDVATIEQNPALAYVCEHLETQIKKGHVPVIMRVTAEKPFTISSRIRNAFLTHAHLGFLNETQITQAAELFNGAPIATKGVREKDITPADVADAVRQMKQLDLPENTFPMLLDRICQARRGKSSHRISPV